MESALVPFPATYDTVLLAVFMLMGSFVVISCVYDPE